VHRQVSLHKHAITLLHTPSVWEQVIVCHLASITLVVVLDLVEVDTLRELIRLAEGDNGDLVLTSHVCRQRRTHSCHDATVT